MACLALHHLKTSKILKSTHIILISSHLFSSSPSNNNIIIVKNDQKPNAITSGFAPCKTSTKPSFEEIRELLSEYPSNPNPNPNPDVCLSYIEEEAREDRVLTEELSGWLKKLTLKKLAGDVHKKQHHVMASVEARQPRRWLEEENEALIEVVKDMVTKGTFIKYAGTGVYKSVEKKLKVKLPKAGLKARPHITSRLAYLKIVFGIVHDMVEVERHSTSGFGWDPEKKMVTAEEEVWKEYLKVHPEAAVFKYKPCPYYEDLCIIFGKHRVLWATSKGTQDHQGKVNEDGQDENRAFLVASKGPQDQQDKVNEDALDEESTTRHGLSVPISWPSIHEGDGTKVGDDLIKGLSSAAYILGKEIRAACAQISHAIGYAFVLSEKRSKINEEVSKLCLSMSERHRATRMIARRPEMVDVFFSIPDSEKKDWVLGLLRGTI